MCQHSNVCNLLPCQPMIILLHQDSGFLQSLNSQPSAVALMLDYIPDIVVLLLVVGVSLLCTRFTLCLVREKKVHRGGNDDFRAIIHFVYH